MPGVKRPGRGVALTTHSPLAPRLSMGRAISLRPFYACWHVMGQPLPLQYSHN
jgi:hypothetical protein